MRKRTTCVLLCLCLLLLTGCGRKDGPLTEEEIARANEAFAPTMDIVRDGQNVTTASEISCFFTSYYAAPSEIDVWEFLRYCPLDTWLEEGSEEFQAVLAAMGETEYHVGPIHRLRKEDISALLMKYAGITMDALSDTDRPIYLEEYDSYYTFTTDFGPGRFECVGGEKQGDTIRLWSEEDADGAREVLTIREKDGEYFIQAFEKIEGDTVPSK